MIFSNTLQKVQQQSFLPLFKEPGFGVVLGPWVFSISQLDSQQNLVQPGQPSSGAVSTPRRKAGAERWRAGTASQRAVCFCDSTYLLSVAPQAVEAFVFTDGLCCFPQGFLRSCHQTSSVHQVFVEPLTSDDWEILVGEPTGQNILLLTELNHYKGFRKTVLCLNVCLFPAGVGW